jgi:hypothetical protein
MPKFSLTFSEGADDETVASTAVEEAALEAELLPHAASEIGVITANAIAKILLMFFIFLPLSIFASLLYPNHQPLCLNAR